MKNTFTNDVIYTIFTSVWRIISGPLTLILIPLFITPEVQGYWYTFGSLAALSVFADLGFTTIVSQFSAHEFAFLKFDSSRLIFGDEEHIKRLGSLFRFIIKWSVCVSLVAFPIIFVVGFVMFSNKGDINGWEIPWILYIISSGLSFVSGVCLSFYEGCNQIALIQKNKLFGSIVTTLSTWIMLYLGFGLYTLSISAIMGALVNVLLFYRRYNKSILQLIKVSKNFSYNWRNEFFSLIWRYAISWSSGYFIFQIYTPLSFQFHGSVFAGKVGLTMSLCNAMFTIANVWVYTATPKMNMRASKKDWAGMDRLAAKSIGMSCGTFAMGAGFVLIVLITLNDRLEILERFLGVIPITILLTSWLLQTVVSGLAVYLRAHKKEPLVLPSLVSAIYIAISTYFITRFLPSDFLFLGFLSSFLFNLPWCIKIFISKRKEWHLV
ncbi:hypothetical protein V6C42_08350 [Pseudoclostridium thermosuccinogenes]|uniref:hypothetical protein n=1 Tax=Clostridium thermosuccinogenes TaxID=84032 RepID=UPI002FDA994B